MCLNPILYATHTLVELAVATQCHPGLVSPVHSINMVPFDGLDLVHSHISGKWYLHHTKQSSQGQHNRWLHNI